MYSQMSACRNTFFGTERPSGGCCGDGGCRTVSAWSTEASRGSYVQGRASATSKLTGFSQKGRPNKPMQFTKLYSLSLKKINKSKINCAWWVHNSSFFVSCLHRSGTPPGERKQQNAYSGSNVLLSRSSERKLKGFTFVFSYFPTSLCSGTGLIKADTWQNSGTCLFNTGPCF